MDTSALGSHYYLATKYQNVTSAELTIHWHYGLQSLDGGKVRY